MGRAEAEVLASVNLGVRAAIVAARARDAVSAWMAERDPDALARLEAAPADGWVRIADHVLSIEALAAHLGIDQLRSFARRRMRDRAPGTVSPMVVQSFARSFAGDPVSVARVAPHLWRNVLRNAGVMRDARVSAGELMLRVEEAPDVARSLAWREYLAGVLLGIQDLAGNDTEIEMRVVDAETVETQLRWVAAVDSVAPAR